MSLAVKKDTTYSYSDYLTWPVEERWEIINGNAYNMSPAPKIIHQKLSRNIENSLIEKLRQIGSGCEVFDAPTDVVLDEYNIVQPDVFVICDKNKITEDNIQGAPDVILEIASPSTELKDKREKKNLYEKFGVKEYVIVYPEREYIERFIISDGKYKAPDVMNYDETLRLDFFDIEINLWEVFEKPLL